VLHLKKISGLSEDIPEIGKTIEKDQQVFLRPDGQIS